MQLHKLRIIPTLPDSLSPLDELARNLWFTWHPEAIGLWERIDPEVWEEENHNPVRLLERIPQARLEELAGTDSFVHQMETVSETFHGYMDARKPYVYHLRQRLDPSFLIAFFSMEFGLNEALPIYAGSLGIASGDHLKSASDLNLPLVAVGLLFRRASFGQEIDAEGWQHEFERVAATDSLPLRPEKDGEGRPIRFPLLLGDHEVQVGIQRAQVGRVPLYLLSTDLPENLPADRAVTDELCGDNPDLRLRQEVLLGVGGVRALERLGIRPSVFHLHEDHAAFVIVERMRGFVQTQGLSFGAAREATKANTVFTTCASPYDGREVFPADQVSRHLRGFPEALGISYPDLLALGRMNPQDRNESFSLGVLALRLSNYRTGISRAHARSARTLWQRVWPGLAARDVPLFSITRGIHTPSYLSKEMASLYVRYLGSHWFEDADLDRVWKGVEQLPDTELWRTRERCRERLVSFARSRLTRQRQRLTARASEIEEARRVLNPEALTICLAQRITASTRPELLFHDLERLARILTDTRRPVQVLISGRAAARDRGAKTMLRGILARISGEALRRHVVFLEDFDLVVARQMVQGADVWLNTSRKSMESCGTSGMKAAANGALNLHMLNGWWEEGYHPSYGWAIGQGELLPRPEAQDEVDSAALYALLEHEVVPAFYDRGRADLPREWIDRMKLAMRAVCPVFNSHRMVEEYMDRFYMPAFSLHQRFYADLRPVSEDFAGWQRRVRERWGEISVRHVSLEAGNGDLVPGKSYSVRTLVHLGSFRPEDMRVELCFGPLDAEDRIVEEQVRPMSLEGSHNGDAAYRGSLSFQRSGRWGFALRVLPQHPLLEQPLDLGLVVWG